MAVKEAFVRARVEPELKERSEKILGRLGLSTTEAIRIFLHQILLHHGLPFELKIPNATTVAAIREGRKGKLETAASVSELNKKLGLE